MPSPQADALSRAYRASQIALAARAALLVRELWSRQLDPTDIVGSANRWMLLAIPLIIRYREQSAAQGATFYTALRALELPDAPRYVPQKPKLAPDQALRVSLWATGPSEVLRKRDDLLKGYEDGLRVGTAPPEVNLDSEIQRVIKEAEDLVAGAAMRHAANGGRAALDQARESDKMAVGYYRETGPNPCYFCVMLASRGIVYKEDSFDASDARFEGEDGNCKVHDWCACHNRPAFSRADKYPGSTKRAHDLWMQLPIEYNGAPASGKNAIRAFRNLYDAQMRQKT